MYWTVAGVIIALIGILIPLFLLPKRVKIVVTDSYEFSTHNHKAIRLMNIGSRSVNIDSIGIQARGCFKTCYIDIESDKNIVSPFPLLLKEGESKTIAAVATQESYGEVSQLINKTLLDFVVRTVKKFPPKKNPKIYIYAKSIVGRKYKVYIGKRKDIMISKKL